MASSDLPVVLAVEASAVGVSLSASQIELLVRYLGLVSQWRVRARLTAITDAHAAARLHVADSLLCLRAGFATGASLIDVGSGAGLPGIPLKIARPDLVITLIEAESRKAAFLELAVRELGLQGSVECARAEDAGHSPRWREQFDVAVARAVAPLPVLCELVLPFVRPGGKAVLLKGPAVRAELRRGLRAAHLLGGSAPRLLSATLAGGEQRVVVIVEKATPTPASHPRRPGIPQKRPL